jgi:uncharacterized protein (TIGR04255 family)
MFTWDRQSPDDRLPVNRLVRCLVQVRYSKTQDLITDEGERNLAQYLVGWPVRSNQISTTVNLATRATMEENLRLFESVDASSKVTVGAEFVALETNDYRDRASFVSDLNLVLDAVSAVVPPARVERIGIRYTNAFELDEITFLNPKLVGLWQEVGHNLLRQNLVQAIIRQDDAVAVSIASGLLPAGESIDQGVATRPQDSWLLDVDSYSVAKMPFNGADVAELTEKLARNAFIVFHWAAEEYITHARNGA